MVALTVKYPGHFKNKDVVQIIRIVHFEQWNQVLGVVHIHIRQASFRHVEEKGDHVTFVLPVIRRINQILHCNWKRKQFLKNI